MSVDFWHLVVYEEVTTETSSSMYGVIKINSNVARLHSDLPDQNFKDCSIF